jgi:type IV pilus assembly protein PilW
LSRVRRTHGFSIIEMLVALALSGVLLAGVVAMFLSSRTSYAAAERLSQIHENGRHALDEMIRDVRAAGFRGCAREQPVVTSSLHAEPSSAWDFLDAPIRGFQYAGDGQWRPALDVAQIPDVAPGSDVLLVRVPKRNVDSVRLVSAMGTDAEALETDAAASTKLVRGDVVLAHNCQARSYFMISAIAEGVIEHEPLAQTGGNATASLGYAYSPPTELTAVQTTVYYVAPGRSADASASLWRRTGAEAPQELAAGVERLELQFGVDASGDGVPDELVTAENVEDWGEVRSVSIALLVHSAQVTKDVAAERFQLLDVRVAAPADGRLRRSFVATATPRNAPAELAQ